MRILSVDPGHSTGVALFVRGEYVLSLSISDDAWRDQDLLTKLVGMTQPDVVLLEGIPRKNVDEHTVARFYDFERWFTVAGYRLYVVQPSQWKGLAKRVEIPGQHARDAATMAAWWINKEKS